MAGSRWAALAVMGAIAAGVVGCGGGSDKPALTNIGLYTPGARDGIDWTRQTTTAVDKAARALKVRAQAVEGTAGASAATALTRLAHSSQLVVAPYGPDAAEAVKVATATKVPALVFGDPKALRAGLVGDVEVDLTAGAYQAGALAVHAARARSVGIVLCDDGGGGWTMPDRFKIAAAYVAGAKAADPKAKAAFAIAGSDAAGAKAATLQLVSRNLQMILSICGPAELGVMQGIEAAVAHRATGEDQLVGLIGDKATLNRENVVVTSVLVNPEVAFRQAASDVTAGSFGKRVYTLDLANRGVTLLGTGRTPGDALEFAQKLKPPAQLPTASDEVTLEKVIAE